MIYGFVTQSGGHLRIDSVVGRGTTVRVYLPQAGAADAAAHAARAAARRTVAPAALPRARVGETVLFVEDNDEVRRLGVAALEALGYRVLQAANAATALELLRAGGARIDLLFTDVVLPGGMNGDALAAAVTALRPGLPVLFASGYAPATGVATPPSARRLDKPYSLELLAVHCRQAIDRAGAGDAFATTEASGASDAALTASPGG
jgi:CheY-like chemotaxis protein